MDKTTRLRANIAEDALLMTEDLDVLGSTLMYDQIEMSFKIEDRGHDNLEGEQATKLEDFLRRLNDEKLLLIMNGRWMAVVQRDDRYFLFNCHPTCPDGSSDHFGTGQPAAIFCCDNAAQAASVLARFGCADEGPHATFVFHSVKVHENNE